MQASLRSLPSQRQHGDTGAAALRHFELANVGSGSDSTTWSRRRGHSMSAVPSIPTGPQLAPHMGASSASSDLLLRNSKTGGLEVYDINNNQLTGAASIGTVGLDWQFAGIGPVHGAGESDLLFCATKTPAHSRSTASPTIN